MGGVKVILTNVAVACNIISSSDNVFNLIYKSQPQTNKMTIGYFTVRITIGITEIRTSFFLNLYLKNDKGSNKVG